MCRWLVKCSSLQIFIKTTNISRESKFVALETNVILVVTVILRLYSVYVIQQNGMNQKSIERLNAQCKSELWQRMCKIPSTVYFVLKFLKQFVIWSRIKLIKIKTTQHVILHSVFLRFNICAARKHVI
jgi:hypothetical protein